jgi:hypothetical protein
MFTFYFNKVINIIRIIPKYYKFSLDSSRNKYSTMRYLSEFDNLEVTEHDSH